MTISSPSPETNRWLRMPVPFVIDTISSKKDALAWRPSIAFATSATGNFTVTTTLITMPSLDKLTHRLRRQLAQYSTTKIISLWFAHHFEIANLPPHCFNCPNFAEDNTLLMP